jgi:hypothetical protein
VSNRWGTSPGNGGEGSSRLTPGAALPLALLSGPFRA